MGITLNTIGKAITRPVIPNAKNPNDDRIAPPNVGNVNEVRPFATSLAPSIVPLLGPGVTSQSSAVEATLVALHPKPTRKTPSVIIRY